MKIPKKKKKEKKKKDEPYEHYVPEAGTGIKRKVYYRNPTTGYWI